ncbi:MAG: heme ABC transporter ATP-binding protein [Phototrophicales bacterium]|nr:MAG: heme ABC transporter ATP-binding protein [Phototrophicales bacterium]RMG77739.1 MAG: ABC transporter ATP-binding protein [Chloroflexota bacterium]
MSEAPVVLEVRGLTKRFPGVLANDHIDLKLHQGEVLGLLGENGAGKSTLMNMIYGLYSPDEGEILVNGKPVNIKNPNDAIALGIGMVHQHFQLVPVLTVTENIMLGTESVRGPFLDRHKARQRILQISQQYGLDVDPDALVQDLPVGVQQRVEIIKALYRHANILILDEPSAVLTPQETQGLFQVMRTLIDQGVSIIFISHKLKEVLHICDNIAVLRLGKVVGSADPKTATQESLASMMVGREVLLRVEKSPATPGEPVLAVQNLTVQDDRNLIAVNNLTFDVHAGEILGIAGVQGNGQTELVEAITSLRPVVGGKIIVAGKDVTNFTPRKVTETGVSHVPEDRQKHGMVSSFSIRDNMRLQTYYKKPFAKGIVANDKAINQASEQWVAEYDVRTPSIFVSMGSLSGGNQQKAVVAREFTRASKLLIVAQPTRGVDVGSIEFIHKQIVKMRDAGTGVLLVSTELDEILSLSDRIAVMYAGEIIAIIPAADADRERIGLLMAGVREGAVQHE